MRVCVNRDYWCDHARLTHSCAFNQGLSAAAPDRAKRRCADAADEAMWFAAEVEDIQALRTRRLAQMKRKSPEGRQLLASTNAQLERAFSCIHRLLYIHCVHCHCAERASFEIQTVMVPQKPKLCRGEVGGFMVPCVRCVCVWCEVCVCVCVCMCVCERTCVHKNMCLHVYACACL